MKKILFIQLQEFAFPGLYYLCGALKEKNTPYGVIATNRLPLIVQKIREFKPAVAAFPCMTGSHREILSTAGRLKDFFPGLKILLGGIHPTLFSDVIREESVDYICRGEGEEAVVELMVSIQENKHPQNIGNISWKQGQEIFHNAMRPLTNPLDDVPFPDYSIYSTNPIISSDTYPMVYMIRGCPFSCTYCHNSRQRSLFKGLGTYVRSFSIERILEEVDAAIYSYPRTKAIFLGADTLGRDIDWLSQLLTQFKRKFSVPYTCLIRPEFINEDLVKLLSETGCHMLAFGIESGSERIRTQILGRHYSNEQILTAASLLKHHGVKFRTYNIIGFPTETKEEMLATLDLNLKVQPDFPWCSIFTPYPETDLTDLAISQGYLGNNFSFDDVPPSFFNDTMLQNVDRNYILNLHSLFQSSVLFPPLRKILKYLVRMPHNRLYRLIFKAVYSLTCLRSERRSVLNFLRLAISNRRLFR